MNIDETLHGSIVAEIHAIREQLADQYQNDLAAYSKAAALHCQNLGFKIVDSPRHQPFQEILQENDTIA